MANFFASLMDEPCSGNGNSVDIGKSLCITEYLHRIGQVQDKDYLIAGFNISLKLRVERQHTCLGYGKHENCPVHLHLLQSILTLWLLSGSCSTHIRGTWISAKQIASRNPSSSCWPCSSSTIAIEAVLYTNSHEQPQALIMIMQ